MSSTYPSSENAFRKRFGDSMATIHSAAVSWKLSGSNWNTKHLEALRVLFDTGKSDPLPPFLTQNYRDRAKDIILKTEFSGRNEFQTWPSAYVETHAHKELRQEGALFGSFFVALADVLSRKRENSESKTVASTRSPRIHRAPDRPDMTTGEGLSSPRRASAGSSQDIQIPSSNSSYHPGNDDHHEPLLIEEQRERRKDETVARMMASQFISAVIDLFTDQYSNDTRIEFSDEPTNFILKSPRFNCTCQDDGSIVRKMKLPETGKWVYDSFKCSLEVKSAFDLEHSSSGKGLVKESVLAQQACELMGSMMLVVDILQEEAKEDALEEMDDLPESRDEDQGALLTSLTLRDTFHTLISVHQTTVSFISCQFETEYLKYIYSESLEHNELDDIPFLFISKTKDYDLAEPKDRLQAAILLVALVLYFQDEDEDVRSEGYRDCKEASDYDME